MALMGRPEGRNHFEDPGVDGRLILKRFFRKWEEGINLDSSGSGKGQVAGACECGNEPSCSIECREFLN
jgi:hypothetical protein